MENKMTTETKANRASIRWHVLSKAWTRRHKALEARTRNAATAGMGRAYRVLWRNAERNKYGFKIDHTGRALTWDPRPYSERRKDQD